MIIYTEGLEDLKGTMVDTKESHNSDFQFHLNGDFSLPLQRQLFMSTPADHDLIQEFIFDLNAPQSSELADGEVAATTPQNDSGGVVEVCGISAASFLGCISVNSKYHYSSTKCRK